jgi:hypothetical protein
MRSHPVTVGLMLVRLSLLLLAQSVLRPESLLGGFALLLNAVCVERLTCGASESFDDNLLLQTTVLARVMEFVRSMGEPPPSPIPSVVIGAAWALLGLFATHHAKRPASQERWLPAYLATACALGTCVTHTRMEPLWMHSARAFGLATLSAMLYTEAPPAGALVGRRGFLLCFLPIMAVHWVVAWIFAASAVFVMAGHEYRQLLEERHAGPADQADQA